MIKQRVFSKQKYDEICRMIHCREDVEIAAERQNAHYDTVLTIFWQLYQRQTARASKSARSQASEFEHRIVEMNQTVMEVSATCNISPCIVMRRIFESKGLSKARITSIFRNPDLAAEIHPSLQRQLVNAISSDEHYGPHADRLRHALGLEHEYILNQGLNNLNLIFETEHHLRARSEHKTPDALLCIPFAIQVPTSRKNEIGSVHENNRMLTQERMQVARQSEMPAPNSNSESLVSKGGTKCGSGSETSKGTPASSFSRNYEVKLVCWIDSKAKFGDPYFLSRDYEASISSYVGRFGPGLVIYWFGFVSDLNCPMLSDKGVTVLDHFPHSYSIVTLDSLGQG